MFKSFQLLGAVHLKAYYDVQKEHMNNMLPKKKPSSAESKSVQNTMDTFISNTQLSEAQSIYPTSHKNMPQALKSEEDADLVKTDTALQPVKLQSIEADLNEVDIDSERIIESSVNIATLHEYVPATKIKGLFT